MAFKEFNNSVFEAKVIEKAIVDLFQSRLRMKLRGAAEEIVNQVAAEIKEDIELTVKQYIKHESMARYIEVIIDNRTTNE